MTQSMALLGFGCVLAACGGDNDGARSNLPDIEVSTLNLDFGDVNWGEPVTRDILLRNSGELPMGLSRILVAPDGDKAQDYEENFSVLVDFTEAVCDDGSSGDAKDVSTDGKKPKDTASGDSGDTGFYEDTGDTADVETVQQVLNPGCELPIHVTMDPVGLGEVQAGLLIVTKDEPTENDLSYYRDPDEEFKLVKLEANAINDKGRIFVDPMHVDFGFVWAGDVGTQYVRVENVGQGDLELLDWRFSKNCIGILTVFPEADEKAEGVGDPTTADVELEPGDSASFEITYNPLTPQDVTASPECTMKIVSSDPNSPPDGTEVELRANQPGLAVDKPPVVQLISPAPGYLVNSGFLVVEIDMWDANQPASSLDCYIRSAHLKMAGIADCVPTDKSGHVIVEIPAANTLEVGTDTIEVIVTDAFGQKAVASTTILYLTDLPEHDGDGDGYVDHNFDGDDCDDADATIYPEAAELPDGKDNNCEEPVACVKAPCAFADFNPCIDEGTIFGDDDKDCFIEAPIEPYGFDCNDSIAYGDSTYPEATEIPDNMDNDCNGIIDEGTSAYDDDGDGYDEFNGDCNGDEDPAISPAAIEYCDGIDNDCDDYIDDAGACIPIESRPVILGGAQGVWAEKTDIGINESTTLGVYGFDADGDNLTFVWTQDPELAPFVAIEGGTGPVVAFTAPDEVLNGADKHRYDVSVQISDELGNQTYAFGYVWVYDSPVDLTIAASGDNGGCKKNGNQAFAPLLPLALLAWASGRRRRVHAA